MIVTILKEHKVLKGKVGSDVKIDAKIGNHLACIGVVRVVQHDSVGNAKTSKLIERGEPKDADKK